MVATCAVASRRPRTPGGVRGTSACFVALALFALFALARRADASPDEAPLALAHAQHGPTVPGYGGGDTALEAAMVEWLQDAQQRRQRADAAAAVDRATEAAAHASAPPEVGGRHVKHSGVAAPSTQQPRFHETFHETATKRSTKRYCTLFRVFRAGGWRSRLYA